MSERCPACESIVQGAVKVRTDSFSLVCPDCYAEFSVASPTSGRPLLIREPDASNLELSADLLRE